jgi:hypothetical protein
MSRSKGGRAGDDGSALDVVERYDTYEDYLDSQLTSTGIYLSIYASNDTI